MPRRYLRVLFLYNGISVLTANLIVPLYSVYVQQLHGSMAAISVSWMVLFASTTLFSVLLTVMPLTVSKETLLLAGYIVRAVAWASFIFVGSIATILMLQVLLGLGEALGSPAFDAMFAERMDPKNRIGEYARWKFVSNIMTAIGVGVGGVIVATFGFPMLFGLMSFLAIVCFLGMFLQNRSPSLPQALPFALEYVPEYVMEDRED